jgi:rhodanese-related sulfurtransferase
VGYFFVFSKLNIKYTHLKMKQLSYILFLLGIFQSGLLAQSMPTNFDKMLKGLLSFSVPTVSCKEAKALQKEQEAIFLDARELPEYRVSHLPFARHIGYDDFKATSLLDIPKNKPLILYCTVGYRSEKMGEKLQALGYTKVYNLYGSIFQWVNEGNKVVDMTGKETEKVHTYNRSWSKWLLRGKKVY